MKTIYVKESVLNEAVAYLNDEMTFFGFLSHIKAFLKQLLMSPISADIDDYLKKHGLERKELINLMIERNIIIKDTKIEDTNNKDNFVISYKVPKHNFERKIRRLFSSLFEKNEIQESKIIRETDCGGAMQGGGTNPDAGQYVKPFEKVQRRKIYVTEKQAEMLKEMGTTDAGDYQYDVPFNFNNGNDPAYDHKNMFAKGFPNKKRGVRKKKK